MILSIEALTKSFYQPRSGTLEVLSQVSFSLGTGETLAITGQSGCGKTTLLSLIAGLDSPDRGCVILEGENLSTMNESRLARYRARKIGIVFQQFHLMPHLTAQENISLPLEILNQDRTREGIQDRTLEMLEKVGLADRRHHLPGQLSGGECQRVSIARALIVRPTLLLADEPTGNLDTTTGDRVARLLFDLVETENRTLILVTHNSALAAQCQTLRKLEQGRLV